MIMTVSQSDFIPEKNFQTQDKIFTISSINGCFAVSTLDKKKKKILM